MNILSAHAVIMQALLLGDGHGMALIDRVRKLTKSRITVSQGSTYQTLRELERKKLVRSYGDSAKRPGRPIVIYALTRSGRTKALKTQDLLLALFTRA